MLYYYSVAIWRKKRSYQKHLRNGCDIAHFIPISMYFDEKTFHYINSVFSRPSMRLLPSWTPLTRIATRTQRWSCNFCVTTWLCGPRTQRPTTLRPETLQLLPNKYTTNTTTTTARPWPSLVAKKYHHQFFQCSCLLTSNLTKSPPNKIFQFFLGLGNLLYIGWTLFIAVFSQIKIKFFDKITNPPVEWPIWKVLPYLTASLLGWLWIFAPKHPLPSTFFVNFW